MKTTLGFFQKKDKILKHKFFFRFGPHCEISRTIKETPGGVVLREQIVYDLEFVLGREIAYELWVVTS